MPRLLRCCGLLVLAAFACQGPPGPKRSAWNSQQLAQAAAENEKVGGMEATGLATRPGAVDGVPFRTSDYEAKSVHLDAAGPAILPGFAEGGTAAYFVTEVWENSFEPVVQPVYAWVSDFDPSNPPSRRLTLTADKEDLVPTVFGVGNNSAFGSPFWQAHFVVPKDRSAITFDAAREVRDVLELAAENHPGAHLGCPIIPAGVAFVGDRGVRPLTFEPVKRLKPVGFDGVNNAWVDRQLVKYVDLGPGTFQVDEAEGYVESVPLFTFVAGDLSYPVRLELPAVLAAEAKSNGLADRVDVYLNSTEYAVFVPAGPQWDNVRGALRKYLRVPTAPAGLDPDVAKAYTLRVAKVDAQALCFATAATFPSGCTWLDSQAAIEANTTGLQRLKTGVRLSVWTVLFNGAIP